MRSILCSIPFTYRHLMLAIIYDYVRVFCSSMKASTQCICSSCLQSVCLRPFSASISCSVLCSSFCALLRAASCCRLQRYHRFP